MKLVRGTINGDCSRDRVRLSTNWQWLKRSINVAGVFNIMFMCSNDNPYTLKRTKAIDHCLLKLREEKKERETLNKE